MGLAVSPIVAGFIGAAGLRMVFVADVVLLVLLGLLVWRAMRLEPMRKDDATDPALADP
jgi:hypothetical protein